MCQFKFVLGNGMLNAGIQKETEMKTYNVIDTI